MIKHALRRSVSLVPWRLREWIKRAPLIAPLQRWVLGTFLSNEEFVHTVDAGPARGLRFPIRLPDDKQVWTGTYELEFSRLLASAVESGDTCVDIGAWRGFFSGVLALAGASRVFIFEPLPANCAHIRRLIALNPQLPLELVEAAVGERAGTTAFEIMPATSMGKLADSPFQPAQRGGQRIDVRVVSLDDLVASGKLPVPGVLKIDVEGAELFVLRGALAVLKAHHPRLFMEIHSRELCQTCFDLLTSLDYSVMVLETERIPDGVSEPEVCHFFAAPKSVLDRILAKRS